MSNPFEEMIRKFSEAVPEPLRNVQDDLEQNMRGIFESGLQKMNLVTREEFEIQNAVLQRTREKLDALEKTVAELEGGKVLAETTEVSSERLAEEPSAHSDPEIPKSESTDS